MRTAVIEDMDVCDIHDELKRYIEDVEPNIDGKPIKDELIDAIDHDTTHYMSVVEIFLENERIIAEQTGETRIVELLEKLMEIDGQPLAS